MDKDDELIFYQMTRYISSNKRAWRLFYFPVHERYPTVSHLNPENPQQVMQKIQAPPETTLAVFFKLCNQYLFAAASLYKQVLNFYTWIQTNNMWKRRAR